jgi:hypothetical protein
MARHTPACPTHSSRINAMTDQPRNNATKTRGRPFEPGNPGRPKGARNKATLAAEALLDGEAEAITRKAIELALAGDVTALRLCWDRIVPARKDRPVTFALPKLEHANDAVTASAAIIEAIANGDLTPSEAAELSKVVDGFAHTLEAAEFEERLTRLEQAIVTRGTTPGNRAA